jgi:hypothetical protein
MQPSELFRLRLFRLPPSMRSGLCACTWFRLNLSAQQKNLTIAGLLELL